MADNSNAEEGNATEGESRIKKLSVQVVQHQSSSSNVLPSIQSPVSRRKSSIVNVDAWMQRRGSQNSKAFWSAETADVGRARSSTSTSPFASRVVSRENSVAPSRNPSSENQPSNPKPDNEAGGPRRKSLGWPGMSSPTKHGDAGVPDNSMAQFKGLMKAAAKGRELAKRAQGQTDAMSKLEEHFKENDSSHQLTLHRRTKREQLGVHDTDQNTMVVLPFMIFHPFAVWRLCWDMLIMILLFYSFITVPIRLAFETGVDDSGVCNDDFFKQSVSFYFDLAVDSCFMADILVTFRTAFFLDNAKAGPGDEHKLISDWKIISLRYLKSFFIVDVSSSLPMDLILLDACGSIGGAQKLIRGPIALKIVRMIRVLKLVRITRLRIFLNKVRDILHIHPGVLRVIRFIFVVMLALHYNACIFFYIGANFMDEDVDNPQSWVTRFEFYTFETEFPMGQAAEKVAVINMPMEQQYLVALYWSATTMATVGYGDITPVTSLETAWVVIVLVQAGVAFSYMVGNMASLLSRINPRQTRHEMQMEVWEDFMHRENIPADIRGRIRSHKNHTFRNPTIKLPEFARSEMSQTLLRDLTAHLYSAVLHSLPMLKGLDERTLTEVALALEPIQLAPNSVIYREDELADCMYFLSEGTIEMSILLIPSARKADLGLHIIADTAVRDTMVETDGGAANKPRQYKMKRDRSMNVIDWAQNTAISSNRMPDDWSPRVFKWHIDHSRSQTFFGEGALTSRSPLRKASAVALTWCTLFRLDRDVLKRIASKSKQMDRLYRHVIAKLLDDTPCHSMSHTYMQRSQACRLLRSARVIIYGRRAKWSQLGRMYVQIEKAENLPKMDHIGLCDAYCTLQLGYPEIEDKKLWKSMVQYNKLNPTWKETFVFPLDVSANFLESGHPIILYLKVLDHDVVGEHDMIGQASFELTDLCLAALNDNVTRPVSTHKVLQMERNGVMRNVKGYNNKNSSIHIFVQVTPPVHEKTNDVPAAGGSAVAQVSVPSVAAPDASQYGSENAKLSVAAAPADNVENVNGVSFGALPGQIVSGESFGSSTIEPDGPATTTGTLALPPMQDEMEAGQSGNGADAQRPVFLTVTESDLLQELDQLKAPNDMGILFTEIAAESGCSINAHAQHKLFASTAALGDEAKSADSKESEPGGVNGTDDAGSLTGSFQRASSTKSVVDGPAVGGRTSMSALMKQLDDDRKASEHDVRNLQEKLDRLQGGVDQLSGVIEEIMLISSKKAS